MDDQYLDAFIRETEESITDLNNSLLALENDPDDEAATEEIFRTAHTLKGNFGAMGFDDASDLAHAVEDLLDEFRAGEMEPTPDLMDLVFDGVDQIEAIVAQIEERGEADADTSETVTAIRSAIGENAAPSAAEGGDRANSRTDDADEQADDADGRADDAGEQANGGSGDGADERVGDAAAVDADATDADATDADATDATDDTTADSAAETDAERPDDGPDPATFEAALDGVDADGPLVGVEVDVRDSEMPGVDGMFVFGAAVDAYDLVSTDPDPEAIEAGNFGGSFGLIVRSDDPDAVAEKIGSHSKATGATATLLDVQSADAEDARSSAGVDDASTTGSPSHDDRGDETVEVVGGEGVSGTRDADAENADAENADAGDTDDGSTASGGDPGPEVAEIKSVRIDVDQLDDLHGLVEQLVTSRIKLRQAVEGGDLDAAASNLDELDKITGNLQNTAMDMRLLPVKKAVNKFPRLVRDLARDQNKEIDFQMAGTDVELDRTILDGISDPLMHVLRNAVGHGIEPPDEREAKGKPREGKIRLRATRERDHVIVMVEDDGGGLDVERIRQEAVEEGVRTSEELELMDDSEIYDLIYHPGFSTTDEVTDVSGRGVGMDVVHQTVSRLDGSVSVESEPDEGTTVTLRLPVSVAIVKVLFVRVGDEEYGIPIKNVDEISRSRNIETINGEEAIEHDGSIYPVVNLAKSLDADGVRPNGDGMFVRVREEVRPLVLHCSDVDALKEVVIKPFQGQLSGVDGLSGTAIVGDGKVVPILDVVTL